MGRFLPISELMFVLRGVLSPTFGLRCRQLLRQLSQGRRRGAHQRLQELGIVRPYGGPVDEEDARLNRSETEAGSTSSSRSKSRRSITRRSPSLHTSNSMLSSPGIWIPGGSPMLATWCTRPGLTVPTTVGSTMSITSPSMSSCRELEHHAPSCHLIHGLLLDAGSSRLRVTPRWDNGGTSKPRKGVTKHEQIQAFAQRVEGGQDLGQSQEHASAEVEGGQDLAGPQAEAALTAPAESGHGGFSVELVG